MIILDSIVNKTLIHEAANCSPQLQKIGWVSLSMYTGTAFAESWKSAQNTSATQLEPMPRIG